MYINENHSGHGVSHYLTDTLCPYRLFFLLLFSINFLWRFCWNCAWQWWSRDGYYISGYIQMDQKAKCADLLLLEAMVCEWPSCWVILLELFFPFLFVWEFNLKVLKASKIWVEFLWQCSSVICRYVTDHTNGVYNLTFTTTR